MFLFKAAFFIFSHQELLDKGNLYADMWRQQLTKHNEGAEQILPDSANSIQNNENDTVS